MTASAGARPARRSWLRNALLRDDSRIFLLIVIMACVALLVGAIAIGILYSTALGQQRDRLLETARSQARLLEATAAFDARYSTYPDGPLAATLSRFAAAHESGPNNLGRTGELTLARRDGPVIGYLFAGGQALVSRAVVASWDDPRQDAMRRALSGETGTLVGEDPSGARVLAAYAPVAGLGLGIVAEIGLEELRAPFVTAARGVCLATLIFIALGTGLFFAVGEPVIQRLRESEIRYRELFDNMSTGVAVFAPVAAGADFVFKDLNRAGEAMAHAFRGDLVGRRLTEVFPAADEFGLLAMMGRVWRTGRMEHLPSRYYADERIQGWRECSVYKVPSGDVVTLFTDVSAQEVAARELAESEARFRSTFENAAVGMAHIGADGHWLRVNQRLCDIVGYSLDELLDKTFQDLTHPDDLQRDLDLFTKLIAGELSSYQIEKRYFHRDGHVVWVGLTAALQRDDAGRPLYGITIIEDINARKQTEQALKDSENRIHALLDASPDEIFLLSTTGAVLAINKAAEARLQPQTAEATLIGAQLDSLIPRDQAFRHLAVRGRVAATGAFAHYEQPIGDGWFEFWYYPVTGEGGKVSEVALFARDVSERKKAEADLRKLYQAIQQSPVSVVITDPQGRIEYVNPKFTEVSGYSLAEAMGENPRLLRSGDTPAEEYRAMWETITAGKTWRGEFHNRRKDGALFWELASIAPVKDTNGKVTHYVAVKEEITGHKNAEENLRQAQKLQAIGQLTGGIAHDFNNLLAIITGNLQLLKERIPANSKVRELMDDALWSAHRGADLVHRLLAFARRQPLQPDVIDINAVISEMTDLLRRTLGVAIEIRENLADDLWPAFVDRGELERALVNLAVNARDAMKGGGTLTLATRNVTLEAADADRFPDAEPGDYALLEVRDTGEGMAEDVVKRAFEPFFTTKGVGKGSGLGLSMVYGFAKQSGGHAALASAVGHGTTAMLFLPRAQAAAGPADGPQAAATKLDLAGRTVLLVEDEARLRKVAARMLQRLGLRVVEAEGAQDALAYLDGGGPLDLLFTDFELPGGMNGVSLIEEVARRRPRAPALLGTGHSRDVVGESLEGVCPVIYKPYHTEDLGAAVRAVLASAREPKTAA